MATLHRKRTGAKWWPFSTPSWAFPWCCCAYPTSVMWWRIHSDSCTGKSAATSARANPNDRTGGAAASEGAPSGNTGKNYSHFCNSHIVCWFGSFAHWLTKKYNEMFLNHLFATKKNIMRFATKEICNLTVGVGYKIWYFNHFPLFHCAYILIACFELF